MTTIEFSQAYETGLKRTMAFLLSRGVPSDAVADVAQTAWLRGWERLGQLRDDRMILPWIHTIALNQYRRIARSRSMEEPWRPEHSDLNTTFLNWAAIDVARILKQCRPSDRQMLLGQLRGQTAEELAAERGVSPTAIRVRMFRARRGARERCEPRVDLALAS